MRRLFAGKSLTEGSEESIRVRCAEVNSEKY